TLDGHPVGQPDYPNNRPPANPTPEPVDPHGDTAVHIVDKPPPTDVIPAEDQHTNRITTEQDVTREHAPPDDYAPPPHPPVDPLGDRHEFVTDPPPVDPEPAQAPETPPTDEAPPVDQTDPPPPEETPSEAQRPQLAPGDGAVPVDEALDNMERGAERVSGESAGNMRYRWRNRLGMP